MKHQNCKIEVKTQCLDFMSGNTSKSQFIKKRKIVSGTKPFFFVLREREREMGNDSAANSFLNLTPLLWLRQSNELVAYGVSIWG